MAQNIILPDKTAADIDDRVARVIRGLGSPEPPIHLEQVRELLKLDVSFYRADDPTALQETVSRMRVAGKQIFQRPTILLDAIRKASLKALYVPDGKRILLDADLPTAKHRWNEAHEVGHSLIPWHEAFMHGDDLHTLNPECHAIIESEANFAAGRLLFLRDLFTEEARSLTPNFDTVKTLKGRYGNTMASTLYRLTESFGEDLAIVGAIGCHPYREPADFLQSKPLRHVMHSKAFRKMFSKISDAQIYRAIKSYCQNKSGGPLGQEELLLEDDNGEEHLFSFETFYNRYDALTIGIHVEQKNAQVYVG